MEFFFPTIDLDSNEVRKDSDRESQSACSKIAHTPLTNLGCESEFVKLDNRIKICGGTISMQAIYIRRSVVTTNDCLLKSDFLDLPINDKKEC